VKVTSYERRVKSEEEQGGGGRGRERGERRGEAAGEFGGGAAVLLRVGAGCGAVVMGAVFFWPWMLKGAEWVGWVVRTHPGLVMVVLIVVAVGALRLARWVDERGQ